MTAVAIADDKAERLPPVTVTNEPLEEEQLVGENQQPVWTTSGRMSGTTRAYVLPAWMVEFTQWWRPEVSRGSSVGDAEHLFQEEVEIGLPYRFQLDFYENWVVDDDQTIFHDAVQVELRWAFAEWGVIPLNPTIYGEWKFKDEEADFWEVKLLLAEEIARGWHWGLNATFERQIGDAMEDEIAVSSAIIYTLIDNKLNAGLEAKWEHATAEGSRDNPNDAILVGPSMTWRPNDRSRLTVAPLFGVTGESPRLEAFVAFSYQFGRVEEAEGEEPTSLKSE